MRFAGVFWLIFGFLYGKSAINDPISAYSFKIFGEKKGGAPSKETATKRPAQEAPKSNEGDASGDTPATSEFPLVRNVGQLPFLEPIAKRRFYSTTRKISTCHTFRDTWKSGECYSLQTDGFFWFFGPDDQKRIEALIPQYDYMRVTNVKLKLHHKLTYEVCADNSPQMYSYTPSTGNKMQIIRLNAKDVNGHTALIACNDTPIESDKKGEIYGSAFLANTFKNESLIIQDTTATDDEKYYDTFKNSEGESHKVRRFRYSKGLRRFASPFFNVKKMTPSKIFAGYPIADFITDIDTQNVWKHTQLVKLTGPETKELVYSNWKSYVSTEPPTANLNWRYITKTSVGNLVLQPDKFEVPAVSHLALREGHINYANVDNFLGEFDISGFNWTPTQQGYIQSKKHSTDLTDKTYWPKVEDWPKRVYSKATGVEDEELHPISPLSMIQMPSRGAIAYCTSPAGSLPSVDTQHQYTSIGHAQYSPTSSTLMFNFYDQEGWGQETFKFMSNFFGTITAEVEFMSKDDLLHSLSVNPEDHLTSPLNTRNHNVSLLPMKIMECPVEYGTPSNDTSHVIPAYGVF